MHSDDKACITARYCQRERWFVKGRSQQLNIHLVRVITDHGGMVIAGSDVTAATHTSLTCIPCRPADLIVSNLSPWDTLDETAYRTKKERLIQNTLQRLERYHPGIIDLVEYAEAGTAKTQRRYLKIPAAPSAASFPHPVMFCGFPATDSGKYPIFILSVSGSSTGASARRS